MESGLLSPVKAAEAVREQAATEAARTQPVMETAMEAAEAAAAEPATEQPAAKRTAPPGRRARAAGEAAGRVGLPLAAGALFIAMWEMKVFHRLLNLQAYQLPLPSAIVRAMRDNFDILLSYAGYTLTEAVLGMAIGSAVGFVVALAATAWPRWGAGSLFFAASLNAVPIVALAPIMNLWFGSGMGSRVAIVAITTMAAMAINAHKGMNMADPLALDLMRSYAARKQQVFRYVRVAGSLPYVFTALKINTTASMIGAIVGEFFISSRGLGYLLSNSIKVAKMPLGWSCIVMAAIAGILFYLIVERLEKVFIRWHPSRRT